MGMFDYVRFEYPCTKCGTILKEWQTKGGPCELETIEISEVHGDLVYTECNNCKMWNQYSVKIEYAGMMRDIPVMLKDKNIYSCSQKMISKIILRNTRDDFEE